MKHSPIKHYRRIDLFKLIKDLGSRGNIAYLGNLVFYN